MAKKCAIYQDLCAEHTTYFVGTSRNKYVKHGIKLILSDWGGWTTYNAKYPTQDLENDHNRFLIVGYVNIKDIIRDAILKEVNSDA